MPTSYTGNLRLALPTTGELSGTWGDTVNNSITSLLDDAVGGYVAVTITPTANKQALTAVDGAADQARNAVLRLDAGTLSANFELYAPPSERTYVVYNNTGYSCTFYVATVIGGTTAAGVGVVIPNTAKMTVYLDGTNVVEQVNYMSNLALNSPLPVTSGGTALTTIAARSIPVANALNTYTTVTPAAGQSIRINAGNTAWEAYTPTGGTGTVTSVSVVSANGLTGAVANPTTTPAITLSTSITGVLKGNGTAISAATAATDYVAPGAITTDGITMSTARMLGRTTASTGAVEEITVGSGLSLSAGTLTATGSGAALSAVTAATTSATLANGNNPIAWNWTQTTAAQTGFAIGETTASTSGAGSQYLYTVGTLAASTANPFRVRTRGVDTIDISRTGAVTITGLNGTTGSGTTGSTLSFTAGQGASTSAGGAVSITSGAGGVTSGTSGAVTVASGTTSAVSGDVAISSGAAVTSSGNINITVGNSSTSTAGILTLQGGVSSTTQSGNSGGIVLQGGSVTTASIAGGPISITGGNGGTTTTGGIGGAITVSAGSGGLAAFGGAAVYRAGQGGPTGNGGATTISGGNGGSISGNAGNVTVQGGTALASGAGGNAIVKAGNRGGMGGGSSVLLTASNGVTAGAGGAIEITAGNGVSAAGGDITLTTGTGSTQGAINFVNTNVANGTVATTITSLGPTGSSTTIQGWLAIKVGGTARYIPFW